MHPSLTPPESAGTITLYSPFGFMDLAVYGNVSDPAKRYAFNIDGRNYFGAELPDFINDRNWKEKLTPVDGTFSPRGRSLNFWDEQHQEWVAIVQNAVPHWLPTREIARFASPDLKRWTSDIASDPRFGGSAPRRTITTSRCR